MAEVPTQDEFLAECRRAFSFLEGYGFEVTSPPEHRRGDPFTMWFRAGERSVVVRGEGYGTAVAVHMEHDSGLRLAAILLVPPEERPKRAPRKGRTSEQQGQLAQIGLHAEWIRRHATDFLSGDLKRFLDLAEELPPRLQDKG